MPGEKMTFVSEDARQTALLALPDEPPAGTTDVDGWLRSVEDKKGEILGAEIVAGPQQTAPAPAQTPEPQAQGTAPAEPYAASQAPAEQPAPAAQPAPVEEDEVVATAADGTPIKRSELPPELKKYANLREILKTAAHARRYADTTERTVEQLAQQLQDSKRRVAELESQPVRVAPQPQPQVQPVGGSQGVAPLGRRDGRRIEAAKETLRSLQDLDFAEVVDNPKKFGDVKKTIQATVEAMEDIDSAYQGEVANLRRSLDEVRDQLSHVASASDKVTNSIREKAMIREVGKRVGDFQEGRPELKTSKPVFAPEGASVETDVGRFADAFIMRKHGRFPDPKTPWDERNRVINAYLRGDPETVSFCEANGLSPDRFGLTPMDVQNYAICLNVDRMVSGHKVDEYTGQTVPLVNHLGQPVAFPDHEAAYEYLCRTSGISKRRREEELRQAEIEGQKKLERAVNRVPAPTMGREGATVRPTAANQKMTAQDALRVMSDIDEFQMEQAAMRGDRRMFGLYTKCQEILGVPVAQPNPVWPKELVQA